MTEPWTMLLLDDATSAIDPVIEALCFLARCARRSPSGSRLSKKKRNIARARGSMVIVHTSLQRLLTRCPILVLSFIAAICAWRTVAVPPPALLRPLAEYEAVAGGGW